MDQLRCLHQNLDWRLACLGFLPDTVCCSCWKTIKRDGRSAALEVLLDARLWDHCVCCRICKCNLCNQRIVPVEVLSKWLSDGSTITQLRKSTFHQALSKTTRIWFVGNWAVCHPYWYQCIQCWIVAGVCWPVGCVLCPEPMGTVTLTSWTVFEFSTPLPIAQWQIFGKEDCKRLLNHFCSQISWHFLGTSESNAD